MAETIPDLFFDQARALGEQTLFLVKRDGRYQPISWEAAAQDVEALALWLLQQDLQVGDRVLLVCENRPEWAIADIAIQSTGAWTVPVYPSLTAADVVVVAGDCQPRIGIASTPEQLKKLQDAAQQVPSLRTVVFIDGEPASQAARSWAQVLEEGRVSRTKWLEQLQQRRAQLRPEDTCTLIYTSGTTGEPKGVMLSHRNFLSNVDACAQIIPIRRGDLHLSFLPLSHVFERMGGWYLPLRVGASIAYAEDMETIRENMLEVRPTIMLGVPRFFEKLYDRIQEALQAAPPKKRRLIDWALRVGGRVAECRQQGRMVGPVLWLQAVVARALVFKKLRARLGGRLRFFISGSAPLSKEIAQYFFTMGIAILEGYGLTETSPVIAANRLPVPTFGSVGPTVPGVEVRIADDGEILTRGPHVMQGYYKKPEETRAVIIDGWFHTGDVGHLDEAGRLYITDRKKDLIKTAGGKFVAPQKLEGLFVADPLIAQALVFGDKERYCVALIVPNMVQLHRYAQRQEIGAASVAELLSDQRITGLFWERVQARQEHLARFEQVKRIALLAEEFSQECGELTPTMKAKRQFIAKRYEKLLRSLYDEPRAA